MIIVEPSVELLWITENPYQMIERAGRTCYKSEDKITNDSAVKFCGMIKQRGHESVVEHAVASFRIVCDRGISHEIVRHRLASYSQESTRYCNYGKEKFDGQISVIKPPGMTWEQTMEWDQAVRQAEKSYLEMIRTGCSPQIARSVLPTCLKTEMVMTANFREWMHFIKLRSDANPGAHPQIKPIANWIRDILASYCSTIFGVSEAPELVLSPSEVQALRSYIQANGSDAEVNPTLLTSFEGLRKKLGI